MGLNLLIHFILALVSPPYNLLIIFSCLLYKKDQFSISNFVALITLRASMLVVTDPTPPGTGVI